MTTLINLDLLKTQPWETAPAVKPVRDHEKVLPLGLPRLSEGYHQWRHDAKSPVVNYFINTIEDHVTQFEPASGSSGASGALKPWPKASMLPPRPQGLAATAGREKKRRCST